MMKWIRWPGLIAFVAVLGLMAAFWLLIADSLVERAIEAAGTKAVGAKVELRSADLSVLPLGLTLNGLQVTNPEEPMTNSLEVRRIAFLMDSGRLLLGKALIDEMSAEGIRFGTARKTSGAIKKDTPAPAGSGEPEPEAAPVPASGAGFDVPDVKDILGKEDLQSLALAEKVKADIKAKEAAWDARIKQLPDSRTLKDFEARYKDIERRFKGSTTEKLKAVSDAKQLQQDIKAARDLVSSASKDLEADYKAMRSDINAALAAPEKDIQRLRDKYQLSSKGLGNISTMLFGPRVKGYITRAESIYRMAEPMLKARKKDEKPPKPERGKGIDVRFREFNPAPAFWARTVKADLLLDSGPVGGRVSDLSSDQAVTGKPTTFDFSAEGLENARLIEIKGAIDHRKPESPRDSLFMDIKGRKLKDVLISGSSDLPVTIKSGTADMSVMAEIRAGGKFDSNAGLRVGSAEIESSSGSGISGAMGRALSRLSGFTVDVSARGTTSDYDISVSSDIDKALKAAVGDMLKEESRKFEDMLRSAIREKTHEPLSGLSDKLTGLDARKGAISGLDKQLESQLKSASGIKAGSLFKF